jgi:hypothetical protein
MAMSSPVLAQSKYQYTAPDQNQQAKTGTKSNQQSAPAIPAPESFEDLSDAELEHLLKKVKVDLKDERLVLDFICDNRAKRHNRAEENKQFNPGIRIYNYNQYRSMYVCLGIGANAWLEFPEWEIIKKGKPVLGDENVFGTVEYDNRSVTLHAEKYGADTTLHVRGASGNLYTFFVRADSTDTSAIPDATVFIKADKPEGYETKAEIVQKEIITEQQVTQIQDAMDEKPDYKRRKPVDWKNMDCDDYQPLAQNEAGEELNDFRVCHDDFWVIFDFGDRSDSNRRVTFYRIVDGTDQPIRPKIFGKRDQIYMVPHARSNFTLGIGEAVICINYLDRKDQYDRRL